MLYYNYAVTAPLRRFEEKSSTRRLSYLDVQCTVRHRHYSIPVHVSVRAAPDIASYHIVETRIAFGHLAVDGSSDQICELHADAVVRSCDEQALHQVVVVSASAVVVVE